MKFFRKKDKRKNTTEGGQGWMPGFGSDSRNDKHSGATPGGGYGPGDSLAARYQPFGSPPSGAYGPRSSAQSGYFQPRPTHASAAVLARLPPTVLRRIFARVCPHSRDESYGTCEQSAVEDACMLCDLRDLAHCVAVCRTWKEEAVKLLYVAGLLGVPASALPPR